VGEGCIKALFRAYIRGIKGYQGVIGVYFVPETAQVELKSGRLQAPAVNVVENVTEPARGELQHQRVGLQHTHHRVGAYTRSR